MVFFFFKQKTAYEMRISDWSSDVCSSDLDQQRIEGADQGAGQAGQFREAAVGGGEQSPVEGRRDQAALPQPVVVAELEVADAALVLGPGAGRHAVVQLNGRIGKGRGTGHRLPDQPGFSPQPSAPQVGSPAA